MAEWGHVKISRKAYARNEWWNEPRRFSKWEAWEDCIQMSAWKARTFAIGHAVEELSRGEFQASIRFLAERWRWGKHMVEKFLEVAQKRGRLQRQREGQGGTVYLLLNYEFYQGQGDGEGTPNGTHRGTPRGHLGDKTEAVKAVQAVTTSSGADAQTNGHPPKRARRKPPQESPALPNWVDEAVQIRAAHMGVIKHGKLGGLLSDLVKAQTWEVVKPVWEYFCEFGPLQDSLARIESGTAREGEQPVKKVDWRTSPQSFVEHFTYWREQATT